MWHVDSDETGENIIARVVVLQNNVSNVLNININTEKDAVRWCHLTHQFIAGASVHSREPKARVAEVYTYLFQRYL